LINVFKIFLKGCPTSSGKTFISYYVMEKALRYSHDDVVVFIAPIKALANQAAAEIYARFGSKTYPKGQEKSIYAMSMPDYSINDPLNCQVLITVAPTFESMLCENNPKWISKIKYIIIDEIQTINDPDLGSALEKIIHLAKCPMLFISATIGNA
jgi:superfamily II RNA helicase